jgi:hypothetical protein
MLIFLVVTQCGLVDNQHFGGTYCRAEDEGGMFLRNVGIYLQFYTALPPRRLKSVMCALPSRNMCVSIIDINRN